MSHRGYKIEEKDGKYYFAFYPKNSRETPLGVSVMYDSFSKCKIAMNEFAEMIIKNSFNDGLYKIIEKENKYIYECYLNGKLIFYRQTPYFQLENCKKTIRCIFDNVDEFLENDLDEK